MAITPIQARCRRCRENFHLFEVSDQRRPTCPRCGWMLTQEWTPVLLDEARRADFAQRHLIASLRRLRGLPGSVTPLPHSVLRNLFEEVGWERDLAEDPALLRQELLELRRLLAEWEHLDPVVAETRRGRRLFRRVVDWLAGRPGGPLSNPRRSISWTERGAENRGSGDDELTRRRLSKDGGPATAAAPRQRPCRRLGAPQGRAPRTREKGQACTSIHSPSRTSTH